MSDREVRIVLGDAVRTGRAVDLRDADLDPGRVGRAVRSGSVDGLRVDCPDPCPVYEHVGVVAPDASVPARTALAAAARSRGLSAPQDDDIEAARERLATVEPPDERSPDPAAARRRLAGAGADVERLRERVATLRGRIQAAREAGSATDELRRDLAEAARDLSEAETERAAAREALARARDSARDRRDARERHRRLEDRVANLERGARAHLVDRLRDEYAAAVRSLGGDGTEPFAVDDATAALAVARVADLRAPVVLAVDRFEGPGEAADWLGAPVVRV